MTYNYEQLLKLSQEYGDAFYILHVDQFKKNFVELKTAFTDIYSHFNIAYSYKTNYIPRLVQAVNELGGFAEVVSDMEVNIARYAGVPAGKIIFNGPYKNAKAVEELLLSGGTVNIDSRFELSVIEKIRKDYPNASFNLGIRVNFAINDGILSRFGIDVESEDFREVLKYVTSTPGIHFIGLHCHFAARSLETWRPRVVGMLKLISSLGINPKHIDLGGGMFGKMAEELKKQFKNYIPSFSEYAVEVANVFAEYYKNIPDEQRPLLLLEPGSALVGDCMSLVTKVQSIKTVRGKTIATILASMYNINMGNKFPPLRVIAQPGRERKTYAELDFAGFTCIESDYLYRSYSGPLAVGDYIVMDNVGSYSIVFKPPFILPNFAVIALKDDGSIDLIKRAEKFDDLFQTYYF